MTRVYGEASGLSLVTRVEFALSYGPADDPATIPSWNTVESDVLSVRVSRGRKSEDEQMQPGRASIVLRNRTGEYKPGFNVYQLEAGASSYANVPGRRVRIRVSDVGAAIEALRPDRFFELNERSGQTARDRGAFNGVVAPVRADGTYAGPNWQQNAAEPEWQSGPHVLEDSNRAPLFPGNGRYVNTTSNMPALVKASQTRPWSINLWVRPMSGSIVGYSSSQYILTIPDQLYLRRTAANKIELGIWDGSAWQTATGTTTIADNVWRMLTVTYDPSPNAPTLKGWRLYVDGTFELGGTTTVTGTPAGQPMYIGTLSPTDTTTSWVGRIKDVAVWFDYDLSATQMQRLWQMSQGNTFLINGFITSWTEDYPDGPAAPGVVTIDVTDAAYTLAQQQLDITPRAFTTKLSPSRYFPFDDDKLEDVQGGPSAQFLDGSAVVQRRPEDPREVQRISANLSSGVSAGALYLNPSSAQMAQVVLPFPANRAAPTAAMCWFKAANADRSGGPAGLEGRLVLFYSFKANGANWDHWFLGVNAKGVVFTRKETRTSSLYNGGSLVSSSEAFGRTFICNDTWHHVAFLGSTVVVDGVVEAAVSGTFVLPDASIYRIFGGTYVQYGIDEVAIWYSGSVAAADCVPIYRSAADRWAGQTADERCTTLLDLAGWQTSQRDLSTLTLTRLSELRSGTVWNLLQQAAASEAGTVDCAGDGKVRLRGRQDRRRLGTVPTLGLVGESNSGGYSRLDVTADELLLRTAAKVDDVYYEDATAIGLYGRRVYSVSPDVSTNEAAVRAKALVDRFKSFKLRSDVLRWELPSTVGGIGLLVDVGDYIVTGSYQRAFSDGAIPEEMANYECHIEQIDWQIDANKRATVTCQLSPVDPQQNSYFTVGTSNVGGSDILGW